MQNEILELTEAIETLDEGGCDCTDGSCKTCRTIALIGACQDKLTAND